MQSANIRCADDEIGAVEAFYCDHLGFRVEETAEPSVAVLSNGSLNLFVHGEEPEAAPEAVPACSESIVSREEAVRVEIDGLEHEVGALRERGARFCSDIIRDDQGLKVFLRDPSGNLLELVQRQVVKPKRRVHGVYCVAAQARRSRG